MVYNVEVLLTPRVIRRGRINRAELETWKIEAQNEEAARFKAERMARIYEQYGFSVTIGPAKLETA